MNESNGVIRDARKLGIPKMLILGLQHMFAMFGATILVPVLVNTYFHGEGLSIQVTLFCAGIGTLLFHLMTRFKVPAFLGSSFAFLGGFQTVANLDTGIFADMSYGEKLPYACGGVLIAGLLYLLLSLIIKVIGVGGGGGNAVNHMYREGIHDVAFVVCNTDRKALEESPVPVKLQLGHEGLGAGNRPAKAKEATEESINEVQGMLNDGTKMVFITAGMGGGTGTGAAPTIARIAKEMDILTVGIVTIPFRWEGDKKIDQALDGVEEISKHVDALLVINNEKLGEIYPDLSVTSAFAKANDTLLIAAKSIAEIITMRGIINLDFNDVKTVMKDGGVAIMSTGYGEGESRVSEAIKNAQHSPLLNNNDIFNSKKVLLNISYSPDHELMMSEMDEVKDFMNRFNRDFETKFGMAEDPELEQKVKITLLATGFGIQDIHMKEMDDRITQRTAEEQKRLAELEEEEEQRRSRRETYYGKDANTKYQRLRRRHIYIFNPEDLDNADIISMVENSPTYQRDKSTLAAIKVKAEEAGILATEEAREAESGGNGIITF